MKKGVIIAIIIAYLASILVVQFFGLQFVGVEVNVYMTDIQVDGFTYMNRDSITEERYHLVKPITNTSGKAEIHYGGYFYPGTYDLSEESLAANPNRIRVDYRVEPYNTSHPEITFAYDKTTLEGVIYVDPETNEIVFLKPRTVTFILTSHDGSTVRKEIKITLTY